MQANATISSSLHLFDNKYFNVYCFMLKSLKSTQSGQEYLDISICLECTLWLIRFCTYIQYIQFLLKFWSNIDSPFMLSVNLASYVWVLTNLCTTLSIEMITPCNDFSAISLCYLVLCSIMLKYIEIIVITFVMWYS